MLAGKRTELLINTQHDFENTTVHDTILITLLHVYLLNNATGIIVFKTVYTLYRQYSEFISKFATGLKTSLTRPIVA